MNRLNKVSLIILKNVDEILLDYIERLEEFEKSGLYHGRGVALAVKHLIAELEDQYAISNNQ